MSAVAPERLADILRQEGGALAEALRASPAIDRDLASALATEGPRTRRRGAEYALVVEAICEGYELHYGAGRVIDAGEDRDLALLAGDRLYALGLSRLVALGDLDAVAELADVISLCAIAHACDNAELASAAWEAGIAAVGWGSDPGLRAAKALAFGGDPAAGRLLRLAAAARRAAGASASRP